MTEATDLLGGRYALGEVLGRGGMAEVRRAIDSRLDREVAVKVLRADLARDPQFHARFRREAQAAASLDAPCIVAVYDTGEGADGVPWIVMELVEGRTLRDVLRAEGRLLPQRALEVVADVCAALEVAHSAGIVHRDIKPANVMLTLAGEVKVMDFGIARAAGSGTSDMTQTAAVIGTAAYLSPEQARGEHVDSRSDLYSTGCLLYELLAGTPPFVGDSPVAVAYQHVRENPVPPSEYDGTLSPDIDAVVLKAMAKNPANRYQSAQEMREDLLRGAAGDPVQATPVLLEPVPGGSMPMAAATPTLLRQPERARRKGLVYGLFALVLLAVALLVALVVHSELGKGSGLFKPPRVVGLTEQQARSSLAQAGLQVGRVDRPFNRQAAGIVLSQSPDQNFLARKGGNVDLVVSKGIEMTVVPQVVGVGQQEAEAALAAAKLKFKIVTRDGNIPADTVLDAIPHPGTQLAAGSQLTLVVASGSAQVPDVRGLQVDAAEQSLARAGFAVEVQPTPAPGPVGVVLTQTPVNTLAPRGSRIAIEVSAPPAPTRPAPSSSAAATTAPSASTTRTPALSPTPSADPSRSPSPRPSASPRRT